MFLGWGRLMVSSSLPNDGGIGGRSRIATRGEINCCNQFNKNYKKPLSFLLHTLPIHCIPWACAMWPDLCLLNTPEWCTFPHPRQGQWWQLLMGQKIWLLTLQLILMNLPQSFPPSVPRVTSHRAIVGWPMMLGLLHIVIWSPETKTVPSPTIVLPYCPLVLAKSRAPKEIGGLCPRLPVVLRPNLNNATMASTNSSHATVQQHKTSLPWQLNNPIIHHAGIRNLQ